MKYKRIHYFGLVALFFLILVAFSTGNVNKRVQDPMDELKMDNHAVNWLYEGEIGPDYWGELDPSFAACEDGKEQSPINIMISQLVKVEDSVNIDIQYQPSLFTIKNNGHTIQANAETLDNYILLDGTIYKLEQLHFHTPSEHQYNGVSFKMEIHLVHKSEEGSLAVLGVMFNEGNESKALSTIWTNLPNKETESALKTVVDLPSVLPASGSSLHYNGSLTTPLCTEGVKWVLFENPNEISTEQIDALQSLIPNNQRPIQPLNEREILYTN